MQASSIRYASAAIALALAGTMAGCQADSAAPSATTSTSTSTSATASSSPAATHGSLDLQAHRGGRGETTEESRRAFEKALDLGVTTLEFDIVLSKDNVPVVWHDSDVLATKCSDTAPVEAGDEQFPYVGKTLHDLTWAQLQTLDCGKQLDDFPRAEVVQGNRMLQLGDVFALTKQRGAEVRYNIETKIEADHREKSASPQEFVDVIVGEVQRAQLSDKVDIQSFDWRSLPLAKKADPALGIVMLWDETTWVKDSPWTGDVSFDAVSGDIIKAADKIGATVLSPGYTVPYGAKAGDAGFTLVADKALVDRAHAAHLRVVPWTVNDRETMKAQIATGVDGIITDYPTLLREVMADEAIPLPQAYPAR